MEELKHMASNGNSNNKQNRILRAKWMDYRSPSIMMVTIVTTKRLPLLGKLQGENIILTELGQKVAEEIKRIPTYNGAESIEIYSYVIMPDHIHMLITLCVASTKEHRKFPRPIQHQAKVRYLQILKEQVSVHLLLLPDCRQKIFVRL